MTKKKVYWSIGAVAVLVAVCLNFNHALGGYGLSGNDFLTKALATPAWTASDCGKSPSGVSLECGKRTTIAYGVYNCRVLTKVFYTKCSKYKILKDSCKGKEFDLILDFAQYSKYEQPRFHIVGLCSAAAEVINERCSSWPTTEFYVDEVRSYTNYVPKSYTYNDCISSGNKNDGCLKDTAPTCLDLSFGTI